VEANKAINDATTNVVPEPGFDKSTGLSWPDGNTMDPVEACTPHMSFARLKCKTGVIVSLTWMRTPGHHHLDEHRSGCLWTWDGKWRFCAFRRGKALKFNISKCFPSHLVWCASGFSTRSLPPNLVRLRIVQKTIQISIDGRSLPICSCAVLTSNEQTRTPCSKKRLSRPPN
jgi:hypothetical protein